MFNLKGGNMINEQNLERVPGSGESSPEDGKAATKYWLWKVRHMTPNNPGKEATEELLAWLRQQRRVKDGGK